MGLHYENLDDETRQLMGSEIATDEAAGTIYLSNYLNDDGRRKWPNLLKEATRTGTDDSLAEALDREGCFKSHVERRKPKGGVTVAAVPITAAQTLAESQFNMYYMRALAMRAVQGGKSLVVYRAKSVESPRTSSMRMIGQRLDPNEVLTALRETRGVEPPIDIPLPNSGLTVRLA